MEKIPPEWRPLIEKVAEIIVAAIDDPEQAATWAIGVLLVLVVVYLFLQWLIPRWIRALSRISVWLTVTGWLAQWIMQYWTDSPSRQNMIKVLGAAWLVFLANRIYANCAWAAKSPRTVIKLRHGRLVGRLAWRVVSLPFKIRFRRRPRIAKPAVPQLLPEV